MAVEDYRQKGFLKEALLNFVALLGWNAGDDKEFFYLNEMIESFSLERVNKSGAVFNVEKLTWLNFEHLRIKSDTEVLEALKKELAESEYKDNVYSDEYLLKVVVAMRERVQFVKEYIEKSPYFFKAPVEYDQDVLKKRWKEDTPPQMKKLVENFAALENPVKEDYEHALHKTAEELAIGNGKLIHNIRLAVSGMGTGPGLYDLLDIIGKDEVIARINRAVENIKI